VGPVQASKDSGKTGGVTLNVKELIATLRKFPKSYDVVVALREANANYMFSDSPSAMHNEENRVVVISGIANHKDIVHGNN
jgi:hypothetical protein